MTHIWGARGSWVLRRYVEMWPLFVTSLLNAPGFNWVSILWEVSFEWLQNRSSPQTNLCQIFIKAPTRVYIIDTSTQSPSLFKYGNTYCIQTSDVGCWTMHFTKSDQSLALNKFASSGSQSLVLNKFVLSGGHWVQMLTGKSISTMITPINSTRVIRCYVVFKIRLIVLNVLFLSLFIKASLLQIQFNHTFEVSTHHAKK